MPWSESAANLGFSSAEPWLPVGDSHRSLAVQTQENDSRSVLAFTRQCLALRSGNPALRQGSIDIVEAGDALLLFDRVLDGQRLRCAFNLSRKPVAYSGRGTPLIHNGEIDGANLGPYASLIEEIG